MNYNFVYELMGTPDYPTMFFSTESLAFRYADDHGLKNPIICVRRYFYDLGNEDSSDSVSK